MFKTLFYILAIGLTIGALTSVAGLLVPHEYSPLLGIATAVLVVFASISLLLSRAGPLTRELMDAEADGKLIMFLLHPGKLLQVKVPERELEFLKVRLGDGTIYFVEHPDSVLAVPGSRSQAIIALTDYPLTLPPHALEVAYDVRVLKDLDHIALYPYVKEKEERIDQFIALYRELVELITQYHTVEREPARREILERIKVVLANLGYEPQRYTEPETLVKLQKNARDILEQLETYRAIKQKTEDKVRYLLGTMEEVLVESLRDGKNLRVSCSMRALSPADVKAILTHMNTSTYISSIVHTVEHLVNLRKGLFTGLGAGFSRAILIAGAILLVIALLALLAQNFDLGGLLGIGSNTTVTNTTITPINVGGGNG